MPPAVLARMAREIEHVEYAKIEAPPTAPKITTTLEAAGDMLKLFGGLNGQFMIEEWQRGSRESCRAATWFRSTARSGARLRTASSIRHGARSSGRCPCIRYELQPGLGVSAMKHNLVHARVIENATVRHPTRSLDECGLRELDALRSLVGTNSPPCQ